MMQWFSDLATEVQLAIIGIFGTVVAAVLAVWREQKKPRQRPSAPLTLAGALIDSSKADELIRALAAEAKASDDLCMAMRKLGSSLSSNTMMTKRVFEEIREARSDLKDLRENIDGLREEMRIARETARRA